MTGDLASNIARDGFATVPGVLDEKAIGELVALFDNANARRSSRDGHVFGARNVLENPQIRALAEAAPIRDIVQTNIGVGAIAVRSIFFDKVPGANWPVAWHQDLSLAVAETCVVEGWGNWSIKAGVTHVQPPAEVLERMLTLRIHLDDCGEDNGPLRVLPGSHKLGRIPAPRIKSLRTEIPVKSCTTEAGSILAMKPLLLHASSAAQFPHHRRVIHIEYAPRDLLPPELSWAFVRSEN